MDQAKTASGSDSTGVYFVRERGSTRLNSAKLLKAIAFAADKHSRQRRNDAEASPYINHPIAVATVLATEGEVSDEVSLLAAALHDTVEDTQTTFAELEELFGHEVAGLVRELTDDKALEKREWKRLQIEHASQSSGRAKQLKIADKICNIRDITVSPPAEMMTQASAWLLQADIPTVTFSTVYL